MNDVISNWMDELNELLYKIGKTLCRIADRWSNRRYKKIRSDKERKCIN